MTSSLDLPDEEATIRAARKFASCLPDDPTGWTVLLDGELGAGKSTFARALLRALGHAGTAPSPTYTLVEPYVVGGLRIYHVDLYRIGSEEELHFLGWDDLDDGLRLVEWPDRAPGLRETADVEIGLSYRGSGRRLVLRPLSRRAEPVCRQFERAE